MNDKIGEIPKITSKDFALKEIRRIANDDRGHVMLIDHVKWLETKLRAISIIARRGLTVAPRGKK